MEHDLDSDLDYKFGNRDDTPANVVDENKQPRYAGPASFGSQQELQSVERKSKGLINIEELFSESPTCRLTDAGKRFPEGELGK